jgi:uncharacterized membrane protein YdbT with pleckstrin-like domain
MSYIEQNLSSSETVLYHTRLHWIVMVGPCIAAGILGLGGLALVVRAIATMHRRGSNPVVLAEGAVLLLVIAAVIVAVASWKRSVTEMAVTNRRVLVKVGVTTRRSIEIMLSKIESITVEQTLSGRLFNFGTIVVRGTGGTPEPFAKIAHPMEFRSQVQEQIDKLPESYTRAPGN